MTRIEFEAEIPLIEKKGGIIQFPEIWVDTGGDGKTKVVTGISGNLSSVHFMIWRKNTQVSKVLNIQIGVLSVQSRSKTSTHLLIINHKTQSWALQDIENTQKQQPWYNHYIVRVNHSTDTRITLYWHWQLADHISVIFCTSPRSVKVHQKVRKLATK